MMNSIHWSVVFQISGATLLISLLTSLLIVWVAQYTSFGQDKRIGVQKFHYRPTSRLGGISVFVGLLFALWCVDVTSDLRQYFSEILLASALVWVAGLLEDLTHRVGPNLRLVMAMLSAAWLYSVSDIGVHHTDVWPVDALLLLPGASFAVTLLVVAGFTHAVNIVDGFHGLAGGLVVIFLIGIGSLAWLVNDGLVLQLCMFAVAATIGFLCINWPNGRIFLGDAGAYLLGFWVVECGLLLVMRSPKISPMAPVVIGIIPLIETLFSMYRRRFLRNHPVNQPDALHLHTLLYRRYLLRVHPTLERNKVNGLVAPYFWAVASAVVMFAVVFYESTLAQIIMMCCYLVVYVKLYKKFILYP